MKKYTIDWWKNNITNDEFEENLERQKKHTSRTNSPATVFINEFKKNSKGKKLVNIPFAAKDNLCVKGIETYGGSNILHNYIPPFTATTINNLFNEGAVLKMKTILDELGMGGTGLASASGEIYSPWDSKRIVGGSSSGSALAVALGFVPFAIGTDTGDSVRKPAAFNGIVGFKPSWGMISRWGLLPYAPSLDTIGFFANSVKDIETVFEISRRADDKDMTQSKDVNEPFNNDKIKIGVISSLVLAIENCELRKKIEIFLQELKDSRLCEIKDATFKKSLIELMWPVYSVTSFTEALSSNYNLGGIHFGIQKDGENFAGKVINNRAAGFGEVVKRRFALGAICLDQENQEKIYIKAKKVRTMIQNEYQRLFNEFDILLSPATSDIPPLVESMKKQTIEKLPSLVDDFSSGSNLNGNPSITIPLGYIMKDGDEFPFSIEISSRYGTDVELLKFAKKIEEKVNFINHIHEGKVND